jgi:prophage antirepressor-like protein
MFKPTGQAHHSLGNAHGKSLFWYEAMSLARLLGYARIFQSWVMVAVLPSITEAEQYFSAESSTARFTLSSVKPSPFTM